MSSATPTIRLFRPGTFTSAEGNALSFSEADLAATAAAYDPAADPAPLVIGHPVINDPAYGWVKELRVEGGELVAVPDRIDASFAEAVRAGHYARVSAQFYTPDEPSNPAPGTWYLRHIGFLGAKAPAVKGLGTVAFAAASAGVATLEIDPPAKEPSMPDPTKPTAEQLASFAEKESALAAREAELAAKEKAMADAQAKARHDGHVSFAEGLIKGAKLAPAGKDLVVGLLDVLAAQPATASFAEAGELQPADALRKLLDGASPLVALGEAAPADKGGDKAVASFAAPAGYSVDPVQLALYERAKAIQDEKPDLAWAECVRRAQVA